MPEQSGGTIAYPQYVTGNKVVNAAIALHSGQQETWFPFSNSLSGTYTVYAPIHHILQNFSYYMLICPYCRWDDKTFLSQFLLTTIFFFFFFVASKSDFVQTKLCMSICKDVLLTEPCNLHDLCLASCIDSNKSFMLYECFNVLRCKVLSSQHWYQ